MKKTIVCTLLFVALFQSISYAQVTEKRLSMCIPAAQLRPYVTDNPANTNEHPQGPASTEITIVAPVSGSWNVFYTGSNTNGTGYTTNYRTSVQVRGYNLVWTCDMLISDRYESVVKTTGTFPQTKATQPFSEKNMQSATITLNTCAGEITVDGTGNIGKKRFTKIQFTSANILYAIGDDGSIITITFGKPVYAVNPN